MAFRIGFSSYHNKLIYSKSTVGEKTQVSYPQFEKGLIPDYTLVTCHFHPPETVLIPSTNDFYNQHRYTVTQRSSRVKNIDVIGMVDSEQSMELLLLQQTQQDILPALHRYLYPPSESRASYLDHIDFLKTRFNKLIAYRVFERFRRKVIVQTLHHLYPGQHDTVEKILLYSEGSNYEDFAYLASVLSPSYSRIFVEELERTKLYRASCRSIEIGGR